MTRTIAVVYLARTVTGSANDFVTFANSYKKFKAGIAHDLVIVHKGAANKPGTAKGIKYLFDGMPFKAIHMEDTGFDIHAYLKASAVLDHKYVCFMNTHSEICADNWLEKLILPLLSPDSVGMVGSTASYESLYSSYALYSKVIWLCSNKLIPYDHRIATEFRQQLSLHAPEWLALAPSNPAIAARTVTNLNIPAVREGFDIHWRDITAPGARLFGFNLFKPFPNPHLRSNAFAMRREVLNGMSFKPGESKTECVRFETGLDGMPTRLAEMGLSSILVGADGTTYETERWTEANGFRLGKQSNILVHDNQVRAYENAAPHERAHLTRLSWGDYAPVSTALFAELSVSHGRGNLKLAEAPRRRSRLGDEPLRISIVIPTHNRAALVMDAVHTIVSQGYADWECIVFDNGSDEPFGNQIAAQGDTRLRYVRSEQFLPVTESWNTAIDCATGDYVTLLGDDDGLAPDFMAKMDFIVRHHESPDFVYAALYQYFHPGVAPWEPSGYVIDLKNGMFFDGHDDIFKMDPAAARQAVEGSLTFRRNFAFNVQSFCFNRTFLDSLRSDGRIFHSPYPDYYLANVAMALGKVISVSVKPMCIAGVSRQSFGFTLLNNMEGKGTELLATDLSTDPLYKEYAERVLPGPSYNTNYLITMLHVAQRLGNFASIGVDFRRYRQLQIIHALFPRGDINAALLSEDMCGRLDAIELHWISELSARAEWALQQMDSHAIADFKKVLDDAGMHGRPAMVRELDVGSFAYLPELYVALEKGLDR